MVDVFITHKCNLNCSYCFSKEHVNKTTDEISIENFVKLMNFNKTGVDERLGIVGGEPTIHSKFSEIIDVIENDKEVNDCVIYSNGIELGKFASKFKNSKFSFLINCNSPQSIGQSNFDKLKDSIKQLNNVNKNFVLGINLYSTEMDYSYIFDLINSVDKHILRFSLALTNEVKENENNVIEFFKEVKPFLNNFFSDCINNEIVPYNDCNAIPPCILDIEDKKIQLKSVLLSNKYQASSNLVKSTNTCNPIITIFPNMSATRSMCFPYCKKVPVEKFSTVEQLRTYLYKTVDIYTDLVLLKDECFNCHYRLINKCGICKVYKLNKANKIKEFILNLTSSQNYVSSEGSANV